MSDIDARLTEIAARLSVVPLEEFVSARASEATAADDSALAAAVRRLRKPVLAAWVVNVLAAEAPDVLQPALGLAAELRDALDAGDAAALGDLTARRRSTLRSLTAEALDRAARRGAHVSPAVRDSVERTLNAALRDPDAAAAVASARLLRPIDATGMESPDLTDAVSGPFDAAAPTGDAAPTDELAERRRRRDAEREAREAARHAQAAERELTRAAERGDLARRRAEELDERLRALDAERAQLESEIAAAREDVDRLDAEVGDLRSAARKAAADAEKAERRLTSKS